MAQLPEHLRFKGTLHVLGVPQPTNTTFRFIQMKKVKAKAYCAAFPVHASCTINEKKVSAKAMGWPKGASEATKRAACEAKGGIFVPASKRATSNTQMEIEFLSHRQAQALGLKPGPVARLCGEAGKPGRLVNVAHPDDVASLSRRFAECMGDSEDKVKQTACATEVAGTTAPLGLFVADAAGPGMMRGLLRGGRR